MFRPELAFPTILQPEQRPVEALGSRFARQYSSERPPPPPSPRTLSAASASRDCCSRRSVAAGARGARSLDSRRRRLAAPATLLERPLLGEGEGCRDNRRSQFWGKTSFLFNIKAEISEKVQGDYRMTNNKNKRLILNGPASNNPEPEVSFREKLPFCSI